MFDFDGSVGSWTQEMREHAMSTPNFQFPHIRDRLVALDSCSEDEGEAPPQSQPQEPPPSDAGLPIDAGDMPQQEYPQSQLPPSDSVAQPEYQPPQEYKDPQQEYKGPTQSLPTQTMLHEHAAMGNIGKLTKLIDKGMPVNVQDCLGETPLFWALNAEVVDFLVDAGADLEWKSLFCGCTAFYKLATQGKHKPMKAIAKKLQKANLLGDQLSEASSVTQRTALHSAAINGSAETVKELLALGADKDAQDYLGKTPLDLAKARKWEDVVALLE